MANSQQEARFVACSCQQPEVLGLIPATQAFREALVQIGPHVHREQTFVADLLHVTGLESYITFADFMELETYFRRNAANFMASNAGRFKDLRSSMDLMFGFLQQTLAETVDCFIKQDPA